MTDITYMNIKYNIIEYYGKYLRTSKYIYIIFFFIRNYEISIEKVFII